MLGVSNAYTLTVRQGPERGKAFSGPKEKGEQSGWDPRLPYSSSLPPNR